MRNALLSLPAYGNSRPAESRYAVVMRTIGGCALLGAMLASAAPAGSLAIVGARIYPSATAAPLLIENGEIAYRTLSYLFFVNSGGGAFNLC
jgi:hypothetical protein